MTKKLRFLAFAPLVAFIACSAESPNGVGGSAGSVGTAGSGAGTVGVAGSVTSAGSTGVAGSSGVAGNVGAGGTPGTAGAAGAPGTAGSVGTAGSSPGTAGSTGTAGSGSGGGGPMPSGKSAGCGKDPAANDSDQNYVLKEVKVPGITNPAYLAGGKIYQDNNLPKGKWDFQFRPYALRLPKNYDPTKAYAIVLGGGGCGGNPGGTGGGYQPDNTQSTIQIGLQYLNGCFADGGRAFADNNLTDTPEAPYVRQVIADVQNSYCTDKSLVFETGTSSGGWESYTTGCADADVIRAIGPVSGGLRLHRPACTGKQAAIMVEGLQDGANPIGPITPPDGNLDSPGSAAARDEILKRNGCVPPDFVFDYSDTTKKLGNAPHDVWDPAYPSCVKYTGCPADYPVVWCALNCGHQCDNETINGQKVDYKQGIFKFWSSLPPR